jgi:nucleotide-binding universal stress UspA family protein
MTERTTEDPANAPYVILAAVSTDETGEFALFEAAHVAALHRGADLHIVHVENADETTDSRDLIALERRLARAPAALEQQIQRLHDVMPARVTAHLRAGDPARSILQTAIDIRADLIVVGTHQHTRLETLFASSVAAQVLRQAHCPVLVVVPKNYNGASKSEVIEPPCSDCVAARRESRNRTFWCERHSRGYSQPHVYEPTLGTRSVSVMPTH